MRIHYSTYWTREIPMGYRFYFPYDACLRHRIAQIDETAAMNGYIDYLPFKYKTEKGRRERLEHVRHVLSVFAIFNYPTLSYTGRTSHSKVVFELRIDSVERTGSEYTPGYQEFVHEITDHTVIRGMMLHLPCGGGYREVSSLEHTHSRFDAEKFARVKAEVDRMEKEWGL